MWDLWMSMYHTSIISVGIKIDIFEALKQRPLLIQDISSMLNIHTRSVEILVNPLIGLGLINKIKNQYSLTLAARTYLLRDSIYSWCLVFEGLQDRIEFKRILEAIESGKNQLSYNNKTFTEMWKEGTISSEAAHQFTKKMQATIFAPAVGAINSGMFKSTRKLLDVGGGSGCFSYAYLNKYPKYNATIFDLPIVCEIAQCYAEEFNVIQRTSFHPGNFFIKDNWPTNCDGVLLSQILHDWPIEQCKTLLQYAFDILPTNGNIYIHEMFLGDNQTNPLTTACFDLVMFINHKSQQFTKNEVLDFLRDIGFHSYQVKRTFGYFSVISAKK